MHLNLMPSKIAEFKMARDSLTDFLPFQTGDWSCSACLRAIYHLLHH